MNDYQTKVVSLLRESADQWRGWGLPAELALQMERLAGQVHQQCVVAVVGRVKAGKSTFINALLGEDLAKVGTTETTATINYFRYGTPDPDRPVLCYWRGSRQPTRETRAFLDSLQGNDLDTLRRAERIDYLEYHLPNPFLREVVLVDTPGLSAVVDEHQNRTAEFLAARRQLRARHDEETQRISGDADAVIYLTGEVARTGDQAFLEEFGRLTQGRSRALNAVGVLAKIDLSPDVLARRRELAAKVADQLRDSLNTVLPVSAGLRRALDRLLADPARLPDLIGALRRTPPAVLTKFLRSEELYRTLEPDGCPVSAAERRELLGDMPWTVFTTIAQLAADTSLSGPAVVERLDEMAGFTTLREVLERHLFRRARFLRSFRIVQDARRLFDTVRFQHLPALRRREREDQARLERFLEFVRQANGPSSVAAELEAFLCDLCPGKNPGKRLETAFQEWDRKLAAVFQDLQEHNEDFEALQQLEEQADLFSVAEREELRALFGLYGLETPARLAPGQVAAEYVEGRQQWWSGMELCDRRPERSQVARRAVTRYGLILHELLSGRGSGTLETCPTRPASCTATWNRVRNSG